MKFKTTIFTNIVILAIGVLFLLTSRREQGIEWLTTLTGVTFLVLGFINGFMLMHQVNKQNNPNYDPSKPKKSGFNIFLGWFCCAAAIILGAVMVITPTTFHKLILFIFGAGLIIGGIYHFMMLSHGMKPVKFPVWFYIFPSILCLGGAGMLFFDVLRDESNQSTAMQVAGIGLILFVAIYVVEFIGYKFMLNKALEALNNRNSGSAADPSHQIEDVKAVEVKK